MASGDATKREKSSRLVERGGIAVRIRCVLAAPPDQRPVDVRDNKQFVLMMFVDLLRSTPHPNFLFVGFVLSVFLFGFLVIMLMDPRCLEHRRPTKTL